MKGRVARLSVSLVSVAAGIGALALLQDVIPWRALVYAVVGAVVLTGWALRVFWTRELRGAGVWRGLLYAAAGGLLLATAYLWLTSGRGTRDAGDPGPRTQVRSPAVGAPPGREPAREDAT